MNAPGSRTNYRLLSAGSRGNRLFDISPGGWRVRQIEKKDGGWVDFGEDYSRLC